MRYLITGAGSGIGRALGALLARQPAEPEIALALVDRNAGALDDVAEELTRAGARVLTIEADLSDPEAPAKAVATAVGELGGLDALASIAGVLMPSPLLSLDVSTYERTFAVNTRATWLLGKAAHRALRESRGAIVATASISAEHPTPPTGAYSASKAALRMLVRQMALEWGPDGIRCNTVSPGPTDTALTHGAFGDTTDPEIRASRANREALIPLRKIGHPDEVAQAIAFLAGPHASQITGVDLVVDGGLSLALMPLTGGGSGHQVPSPAHTNTDVED
jgi:NAD(P)-dependent dehydrogenase (short-subunit alcohol dehydrogenase family)